MGPLSPEKVDSTLSAIVVANLAMIIYSVFMAILNYKQSQVRDILRKTNEILLRIEKQLAEKK